MPIEPHAVTTVSRRPPVGMDTPRTLQDYQADLVKRFGKVPSWTELAKRENWAMRTRNGGQVHNRELSDEARAKIAETRKAESLVTDSAVLKALTEPLTREDLHRKTGIPTSTLSLALERLNDAGKVSRFKAHRCVIWTPILEAAE